MVNQVKYVFQTKQKVSKMTKWFKTLIKQFSCNCRCKLDSIKVNPRQKQNNDKCWCD